MEMIKVKEIARKRRQKYLSEFTRTGWTLTKLAEKHGMSAARMGKLIKQARKDNQPTE